MFRQRFDLPLVEDATGRFLVWIMAVMIYLGIMALAGALVLAGMADRWENGLTGRLTVQIAPEPDDSGAGPGPAAGTGAVAPLAQRTELALALLRATPGVVRAEAVTVAAAHKLLEPWLGPALLDDLPLPALIDVEVAPGSDLEVPALADRLARSVPGAHLDNHAAWLDDLRRLARTAQLVALAMVVLVFAAAVAAVVFAVRTGLAIHSPVVELLHIMGATDRYVARQFQTHIVGLALRGGAVGLALGVTTLVVLDQAAGDADTGMLPAMALAPLQWLALGAVPLVATGLAAVTARWTVLRVLAALP
jgi:cell division transport system permease protein